MVLIGYVILFTDAGRSPSMGDLFYRFAWSGDCPHYLNIAEHGYGWTDDYGRNILLVFFPLYGYIVRLFALLGIGYFAAAFVVSFACYIAGMCCLYRLVCLDFSKSAAWWAVILVSAAPPAFFFGIPMTEGLFLLTSALSLYFIRTHRWALAGLFGALCMFTRMAGMVLVFAAAVEFIAHYKIFELIKTSKWKETFRLIYTKGVWILLMLAGGGVYLYINWYISGDPFRFLHYQQDKWHNETQYFGKTLITQFRYIANSALGVREIFIPNVISFTVTMAALLYASIKRLPATYIVYTLGYVFVSFAPSWLLSGSRYMMACVPLFIFFGHFAGKKPVRGVVMLLAFIAGLLWLTQSYLLGGGVF
jgi:Gpi18-like mannosyltransferase